VIIQLPSIDERCRVLGERLKAVREARGLTLEALARLSELSVADLSLAEHGRVRLTSSQLHGVIGALRIPLAMLFVHHVDLTRMRRF
jgi:transcriptional regulator with XRE-family HTH domain